MKNSSCSGVNVSLKLGTTEGNVYATIADIFGFATGEDENWPSI